MSPRPKPAEIGPCRLSAIRGPREDGRWYWRARSKGQRRTLWTGWGTRDEASRAVVKLQAQGLLTPNRRREQARTLGDLLVDWLDDQEQRSDLSPATLRRRTITCRHIVAWLGEVPPEQVDALRFEGYRAARLEEGAAPRTVQHELGVLQSVLRWAIRRKKMPDMEIPKVRVRVEGFVNNHRTPEPEEVVQVIEVMKGEERLAVQLLAATGARIAEVTRLRRCDVLLPAGRLVLNGKTGRREVPLPEDVLALIADRAEDSDDALLAIGTKRPEGRLRRQLRSGCKRAGVEPFTPHGIRRMVVNQLLRSGVDLATAASLTGHSVMTMLKAYRTPAEWERVEAVRKAGLGRVPERGVVVRGPWAGSSES